MRAAINSVDVVGKTKSGLPISVVVLQADFDVHLVFVGFHIDRLVVKCLLAAIQMLDELGNAPGVFKLSMLRFPSLRVSLSLVGQSDDQSLVKKREFAQPLREGIEVVFNSSGENCLVGNEVNLGARLCLGSAGFL